MPAIMQFLYDLSSSQPKSMLGRETRRLANKVRSILVRRHDPVVRTQVNGFPLSVHASNVNPIRYSEAFYTESPFQRIVGYLREQRGAQLGLIDIGANVGYTSLMAHAIAPESKLLLIEGDPRSFALLEANTKTIQQRTVVNAVLGERDEVIEGEFLQASGTASFVQHGVTAVSERVTEFQPRKLRHRMATLDALVAEAGMQRVDYIKIDTDGAETKILAGAGGTLRTHQPIVWCEFNPGAMVYKGFNREPMRLFSLFEQAGFLHYAFFDQNGRFLLQADFAPGNVVFRNLTDYCMVAEAVMDVAVFHRDRSADFAAFVAQEQARAVQAWDRFMATYQWR